MKIAGNVSTISESRLSQQMAASDDVAANEEEVEEQIEKDRVERAARATGLPMPIMKGNEQMQAADDAVVSREEVEEQAEESRIDEVAFEYGMSTAAAEE